MNWGLALAAFEPPSSAGVTVAVLTTTARMAPGANRSPTSLGVLLSVMAMLTSLLLFSAATAVPTNGPRHPRRNYDPHEPADATEIAKLLPVTSSGDGTADVFSTSVVLEPGAEVEGSVRTLRDGANRSD